MALYDAFISYSHAKDKPIAAALQSAIQKLGKPWYRRRALRLFRDDTSLSATPHLWPTIEQALGQSRYFLLLASPEAAASKWVNTEVASWLEHNSIDTLLIGLTDGELSWDDSTGDFFRGVSVPLPPALAQRFSSEPKWVDLRPYRNGARKGDARFTELAADFAAAIRGMPKEDLLSQEVRQQRRALTLAWSAAASLLVLATAATAAGIFAYRAQQEAVAQRDRAEHTLMLATDTANGLAVDLAQKFQDSGLPVPLAKDILDRALKLQDQLIGAGENNWQLRASQVQALNATAYALSKLGDQDGAEAAARQAQTIAGEFSKVLPAGADAARPYVAGLLAVSDGNIIDQLLKQGRPDEALSRARANYETLKALAAKNPSDLLQAMIATSDYTLVRVLMAQGKLDDALVAARESTAILETVVSKDRNNLVRQQDLAASTAAVGNVLALQSHAEEAIASYHESIPIYETLLAKEPANTPYQFGAATSYRMVAILLGNLGRVDEALPSYRRGLALFKSLVASDPSVVVWQDDLFGIELEIGRALIAEDNIEPGLAAFRDANAIAEQNGGNDTRRHELALAYDDIGQRLVDQGKLDAAPSAYGRAGDILKALAEKDPENARKQNDLALHDDKMVDLLLAQSKADEALAPALDALAIRRSLAAKDGSDAERQLDVWIANGKVGVVQLAQDKRDMALATFRTGLAMAEAVAAAHPDNGRYQSAVSLAHEAIGEVLTDQGNLDEALADYRASRDILETLSAQNPDDMELRVRLAANEDAVGDIMKSQDELDDALAAYREGLAIRRALVAKDAENRDWQRDLSISCGEVGDVLVAQRRPEEALAAYRERLAIARALAAADADNAQWRDDLQSAIVAIGGAAYSLVLAKDFMQGLDAADEAISLAGDQIWIYGNRAHALMFLDHADEARAIYLKYRGTQDVLDGKSWEATVLADFAEFRMSGLANPLMDEIEKLFAGKA